MKKIILAAAVAFGLGACTQEQTAAAPAAPEAPTQAEAAAPAPAPEAPPVQAASLQEVMKNIVAPSADVVWNAVSYRSTADGVEMTVPETDAEWENIRFHAMQLIEAGNLLMTEGLPVAAPGDTLQDEGLEGNLTREQIQVAMEEQRPAFNAAASAFQAAVNETIAAVDARDAEALSNSGATLDEACEACHTGFWYPAAP